MAVWPYSTRQWLRLQARVIAEHPTCQLCRHRPSKVGDHIVPVSQGGAPFDRANVQATCVPCHNRKTRIEQGQRGILRPVRNVGPKVKGCTVDGLPLDPEHPWNRADGR